MTYEKVTGYTLADKLEKQFRGRGEELRGMRATPTSELMKRAEMGRDPRVNCSEQAFRESYASYKRTGEMNRARAEYVNYSTARQANYYSTASKTAHSTASRSTGSTNAGNRSASVKSSVDTRRKASSSSEKVRERREPATLTPSAELRVAKRTMNPMFLLCLIVGTMMIMFLVIGISDVYQSSVKLSDLEQQLSARQKYAKQLELQLEEKNDIRVIEAIASDELGMVKEDSVQRKYISLSDGEHIELIEDNTDDNTDATGGMLLSAISSSFDQLFERFE